MPKRRRTNLSYATALRNVASCLSPFLLPVEINCVARCSKVFVGAFQRFAVKQINWSSTTLWSLPIRLHPFVRCLRLEPNWHTIPPKLHVLVCAPGVTCLRDMSTPLPSSLLSIWDESEAVDVTKLPPNLRRLSLTRHSLIEWPLLPDTLRELHLSSIQYPDTPLSLSSNLTSLELPWGYSQPLGPGVLPPTLISFKCAGCTPRDTWCFPDSLLHLSFDMCCIPAKWPALPAKLHSLTVVSFYSACSLPAFPPSLVTLRVSFPVLTTIEFGSSSYPSSLHTLSLSFDGCSFGGPSVLPSSLRVLRVVNVPLRLHFVPDSVTELVFGDCWNHPLKFLPAHLQSLKVGSQFNQPDLSILRRMRWLRNLELNCHQLAQVDQLPVGLRSLHFWCSPHPSYEGTQPLDFARCTNLRSLRFLMYFYNPITALPPRLTRLDVGAYWMHPLCKLPASLTKLSLPSNYDLVNFEAPKNLATLKVGKRHYIPQEAKFFQ